MVRRMVVCVLLGLLLGGEIAMSAEPEVLPLWPEGAPGAVGKEEIDVPTISVYLAPAEKASGAAIVVCPGGGYAHLAMDHEGRQVAQWLNSIGVAAAVLQYRLGPRYHHPAMLQDAQRAIRLVRSRSTDWKLDPKRVGIMGFSAGGHLASTAGTHFDSGNPECDDLVERQSCKPDLMILGYPVISLNPEVGHGGSRRNLLGDNPSEDLIKSLSNELQVSAETPPAFLVHTAEDTGVLPENSIRFVQALLAAKVPVEFHLFQKGRHGLGLGTGLPDRDIPPDDAFKAWPGLCETWLRQMGWLSQSPTQQ